MNFKRRDFLRVGTAGITGSVLAYQSALAQEKQERAISGINAEFEGGTGSLELTLRLTPGTFELRVDNFIRSSEKVLTLEGTFNPASGRRIKFHRSYFCADDGNQILARLGDDGQWTTLYWSATDKKDVGSLTVWNGTEHPKSFGIDTTKIGAKATPREYVVEGNSSDLNLKGKRSPPPPVSLEEYANALDNNPDYLAFTRGKGLTRRHAALVEAGCLFFVYLVPGGDQYYAFWVGGG